jgi:hypothetical protein
MIEINQKPVLTTAVAGVLGLAAAPAQALEAEISGHVNRAYMAADDGEDSRSMFVDMQNSNTRFRFVGTGELTPDITAGIRIETEFVSNQSDEVTIQDPDAGGGADSNIKVDGRHFDTFFRGAFGQINLGKGDGAGNNLAEIDISGSKIAGYQSAQFTGGAIRFQQNGSLGPSIGETFSSFDFESRYDRIGYRTPAFGPVVASATLGTKDGNDVGDLAVEYTGGLDGGHRLAAGLAFSSENVGGVADSQETFGGTVSLLLANGWSVTGTYTTNEDSDPANPDASFVYTKVGYKVGQHAFGVNYGLTEDLAEKGDESTMTGLTYVFKPVGWAEVYANAKVHSLDRSGDDFDDVSIIALGSRIKF